MLVSCPVSFKVNISVVCVSAFFTPGFIYRGFRSSLANVHIFLVVVVGVVSFVCLLFLFLLLLFL